MVLTTKYFFGTYAFVEILKGNPDYTKYEKVATVTTKMNLMELHFWLLREEGRETADHYYDKYEKYTVPIDSEIIKTANQFRLKHRKLKLSYIDCLGYAIAKYANAMFLTGDRAFEGMENVEFVK